MPFAGEIVRASDAPPEAFTAFTPAWTASTTNPTIGNGGATSFYEQIGKLVFYWGRIVLGSTTTVGSGTYSVSIPVAADTNAANMPMAGVWYRDGSPAADYSGFALVGTSTMTIRGLSGTGTTALWGSTLPVVPASGDWLSWFITYPAA